MDRIDVGAMPQGGQRDRFFARSIGTAFQAQLSGDATEIDLYDEIGVWGVTSRDFRNKLKETSGDIKLRINSPGGSVTDGIAIYNDLLAHKGTVRVEITGVAASIASIIAMAGKEIAIAENAFMMIHNSWSVAVGNKDDFTDIAALLAKIDDSMARTYASRSGTGVRSIKQMMDDETWMTGKEAKEAGFATEILKPVEAQAKFDLSVFAQVPDALRFDDEVFANAETDEDFVKVLMRGAENRTRTQAKALIKAIKAGKTSLNDTMPGAGDLKLEGLMDALKAFQTK